MKYLSLILSFLFSVGLLANDIKFTTGFIIHNNLRAQTIDVTIPRTDVDIQEAFVKWMADHYDYRLDGGKILETNGNTLSAIGCVVPNISDQLLDIHLQVNEMGDKYKLRFYASFGFDSFITRENNPFAFRHLYAKFKNFINIYLIEATPVNEVTAQAW